MPTTNDAGLRLDKWLWFVRFFKTRSLATDAVRGGHVKLNGERAKPGLRVHPGDRLQIQSKQLRYDIVVLSLPSGRGSAPEAQSCYREDEASQRRRAALADELRRDRLQMPVTRGRPDKRTRRALRSRQRGTDR